MRNHTFENENISLSKLNDAKTLLTEEDNNEEHKMDSLN
jgi:hypothetical protein